VQQKFGYSIKMRLYDNRMKSSNKTSFRFITSITDGLFPRAGLAVQQITCDFL